MPERKSGQKQVTAKNPIQCDEIKDHIEARNLTEQTPPLSGFF